MLGPQDRGTAQTPVPEAPRVPPRGWGLCVRAGRRTPTSTAMLRWRGGRAGTEHLPGGQACPPCPAPSRDSGLHPQEGPGLAVLLGGTRPHTGLTGPWPPSPP